MKEPDEVYQRSPVLRGESICLSNVCGGSEPGMNKRRKLMQKCPQACLGHSSKEENREKRNTEVMKWAGALLATSGQKATRAPSLRTCNKVHICSVPIFKLHRVQRAGCVKDGDVQYALITSARWHCPSRKMPFYFFLVLMEITLPAVWCSVISRV